jgi:hypothetical protein
VAAGIDISAIWTAAGIVVGFSVGAFGFRLNREIGVRAAGEPYWLPRADFVLLLSLAIVLIGVFVLPVLGAGNSFARYSLGWAFLLLAGYPFALAGHYDLLLGQVPERIRTKRERPQSEGGGYPYRTAQETAVLVLLAVATLGYWLAVILTS